jgi:ribosomal protein S18 acetylase RimI-like enzyme
VDVRAATGADAEAVRRVQEESWRVAYAHVFPAEQLATDFVDPDYWRRTIEVPPPGWTLLVAGEPVVGFACVGPSRDEDAVGELYAIYVLPGAWSTGAGRALIERAEASLAREYDDATLWVLEANPRARRFYERAGWRPDGARKQYERWGIAAPEIRYRKRLGGVLRG